MTTKKSAPGVTPIDTLKPTNLIEIVELPGWEPDQTVNFRLRRCSLRGLVTAGRVPNPLLAAAQRLYEGNTSKSNANFGDIVKVMTLVVENALVEPTLTELTDADVELTEEQFGLIWGYAQKGAMILEAFRKVPSNTADDKNGQNVEGTAK